MEKRIEIFFDKSCFDLSVLINDFLRATPGKLHDVKYQYLMGSQDDDSWYCTALIIYTPEGECEEENYRAKKNEKGDGGVQGKITPFRKQEGTACEI
jgi:hypothetical protein